jgi:hypothetical protein
MSSTHRHLLLDFFWQVISGPPCICGVILQNLDWVQLKFDLCQFLCQDFLRFEVPANFKWSGRLKNDESVKKIPHYRSRTDTYELG